MTRHEKNLQGGGCWGGVRQKTKSIHHVDRETIRVPEKWVQAGLERYIYGERKKNARKTSRRHHFVIMTQARRKEESDTWGCWLVRKRGGVRGGSPL